MQPAPAFTYAKLLIVSALALAISACAGPMGENGSIVEQAFNTPGMVKVAPYTRTIFSTTNF
jgi:hypothetical protein